LLDRTRGRRSTYFGDGIVAHIGFAEPFCPVLRRQIAQALKARITPGLPREGRRGDPVRAAVHETGTYVVMEGPAFSTRAESEMYRGLGASVIGMTALPEAKLAREAELCYVVMAAVTDYDCWRPNEKAVTVEMVVANLELNVANAARAIYELVEHRESDRAGQRECGCRDALRGAIITVPDRIPHLRRKQLGLLIDRYLGPVQG
ncbi:MAG: S-methyl-5'-thioadenosine phosphorylase, partial [Chloroflexi bacterium]|nr:S-methyl-5'-thioadenosine phosphorylase [Chloroflexota bacterium]